MRSILIIWLYSSDMFLNLDLNGGIYMQCFMDQRSCCAC